MNHRAALAAVVSAIPLVAQQATYTFFANPAGNPPLGHHLAVTGQPRPGTTFTVGVDYANPTNVCLTIVTTWGFFLLTGLSNQAWNGGPLPAQLPQGFTLLVSPDTIVSQVVVSGCASPPGAFLSGIGPTFSVSVPNNSRLLGLHFYQQILFADLSQTFPFATDGGHGIIGL